MRLLALGLGVVLAACTSEISSFSASNGAGGADAGTGGSPAAGGGSANGGNAPQGGGGACECSEAADCASASDACSVVVCSDCTCDVELVDAGTACGDGSVCDGQGSCLGDIGVSCEAAEECASGFCADGVCCDTACDGECRACDAAGNEGTCTAADPATDPEGECGAGVCGVGGQCVVGAYGWSRAFGGNSGQRTLAVRAMKDGGVVVAGTFRGTLLVENGVSYSSKGGLDIFLARLDANSKLVWSKAFGGSGDDQVTGFALLDNGDLALTGDFGSQIDFGGGALNSAGGSDVFIARLDGTGGHVWSKRYGNNSHQNATAIAALDGGDIAVTGYFQGNIDFGGGALQNSGSYDVFIARVNGQGSHVWSRKLGDGHSQRAWGIAADGDGNIAVVGEFDGTMQADGVSITSQGGGDAFVLAFDSKGELGWARGYGNNSNQRAVSATFDDAGDLVVFGDFYGNIDFGDGKLHVATGRDLFLAKLAGGTGNPLWSQRLGGSSDQHAHGMVADAQGHLLLTGAGHGTFSLGGDDIKSAGGSDVYVAKLTGDGIHLWSHGFGNNQNQSGNAIASDASGAVFVGGEFYGAIDFGGGPHGSTGDTDGFIVKLTP